MQQNDIYRSILKLDQWLQTMRCPTGYTGPISHWWESCLLFCGSMFDWRYEGILCGYVELFRITHNSIWLQRAIQAGNDVLEAQMPTGNYRNSSFQQGPIDGGTPHEAAVDIGLLELALLLQEMNDEHWHNYFDAAERNINEYHLNKLWNGFGFLDMPWNDTLVPNKNATIIEALVLYERLSGIDMSEYIQGAINVILGAQEKTGPRAGGIVHWGTKTHKLAISIYNARAVTGLLKAYDRKGGDHLLEAAENNLRFLDGLISANGVFCGRYPDGKLIANPRWLAGSGDILRAFHLGSKYDLVMKETIESLVEILLASQHSSGGIPMGLGLAYKGGHTIYSGIPDFRDLLPVVGWNDKAFRGLIILLNNHNEQVNEAKIEAVRLECIWKRKACQYIEDDNSIKLVTERDKKTIFYWEKGATYPMVYLL